MKRATGQKLNVPRSKEQVIQDIIYLDNYYFDTARALEKRIGDISKAELFTESLLSEVESLEREIKTLRDSLNNTYISLLKQGYSFP